MREILYNCDYIFSTSLSDSINIFLTKLWVGKKSKNKMKQISGGLNSFVLKETYNENSI